jgi:hypothetical protein
VKLVLSFTKRPHREPAERGHKSIDSERTNIICNYSISEYNGHCDRLTRKTRAGAEAVQDRRDLRRRNDRGIVG